jgi:hypothetical protein
MRKTREVSITIMFDERNPRDKGYQDMLRKVSAMVLGRPFEIRALTGSFWYLVVFYDRGIVDHPMGADAGNPDGKATLAWYERTHEVLGYGHSPSEACAGILRRSQSARLVGIRRADAETGKMRLLFRHLDTGAVYYPDQLFLHQS